MAKFVGFIGTGRGKAGNLVFSKGDNGITLARAYQPQVKNPRTPAQLLQRAKMNVVGQFSKLCPAALITPLGMGTTQRNRSEFARQLLNSCVTKVDNENYVASFTPSDVKFSRGAEPLLTTAQQPVVTNTSVSVTLDTTSVADDLLGIYGERLVLGILDNSSNAQYDTVNYVDHVITQNTAADTLTFSLSVPLLPGQTAVVWRIPFYFTSGSTALRADDIHLDSDSDITAILATSSNATIARWGDTYHLGTVPFTSA